MRIDSANDRICYAGDQIYCFENGGGSFSIPMKAAIVRVGFDVCWIDYYGNASCSNTPLPLTRHKDLKLQTSGIPFSLLENNRVVPNLFPDEDVRDLSVGPRTACIVYDGGYFCSSSLPIEPVSSLTTGTTNGTLKKLYVNTSTVFWQNTLDEIGWFGIPGCDGSNPVCASISSEISITYNFPLTMTDIAFGNRVGYGVTEGDLVCWNTTCPSFNNVQHVTTYNGGACVEFLNSATCFGDFSQTFFFDTFQCAPNDIQDGLCYACPLGTSLPSCTSCPPNFVRGPGQNICVECPIGSQTNADQSECVPCKPYQYKSETMLQCLDCGVGSESLNQQCVGCPDGTARDATMLSCSTCYLSVPANSQTVCQSCPSPFYWSGSGTTWSDGVCVSCLNGQYPLGFSCSLCLPPQIRVGSDTCYNCPPGFEPNHDRTICYPCTNNTIRTDPSPFCFECPDGGVAEDNRCVKKTKPFFTESQSALLGVSILGLVFGITFRSYLSESQFFTSLFMSFFFLIYALIK